MKEKMYFRLIVFLLVLVVFTGLFAGCRGSGNKQASNSGSTSTGQSGSTSTSSKVDSTSQAKKEEQIKLVWTFWANPDELENAKKRPLKFEEANPNIKIEIYGAPGGEYHQKVLTMIAGGTPPDVMRVDGYYFPQFVTQDVLTPFDEYMEKDKEFFDQFLPGAFVERSNMWQGKVYGIPAGDSGKGIYFNATRFKEEGLETPLEMAAKGTWTIDAYVEACKKLTKGEGANKVWGTFAQPKIAMVSDWIVNNGGSLFNSDVTSATFNEKAAVEAIQLQIDLSEKYGVAPTPDDIKALGGAYDTMFVNGQVAMTQSGVWTGIRLTDVDFEWDVAPMPKGPNGSKTFFKPNSLTIPKASKHPDEAYEYIKFLASEELEKESILAGVSEPKLKVNVDYFINNSPIKNAKYFVDVKENNQIYGLPIFPKWFEFNTIFNNAIDKVIAEGVPLQQALDEAKAEVDKLLK